MPADTPPAGPQALAELADTIERLLKDATPIDFGWLALGGCNSSLHGATPLEARVAMTEHGEHIWEWRKLRPTDNELLRHLRNNAETISQSLRALAEMRGAIGDVAAERKRQVEVEGWTPEHDDAHKAGEMAGAAACYAMHGLVIGNERVAETATKAVKDVWPWAQSWWKPKDRRRDLIRAAALIVAEIERLDRAALARSAP